MIDFHAHVLPGIDDGAKDISEAHLLLLSQKKQGIDTVVATSHCLPDESISKFIAKRNAAYELLLEQGFEDVPQIVLGAEVALYYGLSECEDLRLSCIEGTNYILLELPMEFWNDWVYDEIYKISVMHHVRPIIAHLDRYLDIDKNNHIIDKLLSMDVTIQINAEALFHFSSRRFVKKIWKKKKKLLLGSDCHNLTDRKCEFEKASLVLKRLLGGEDYEMFLSTGEDIIQK